MLFRTQPEIVKRKKFSPKMTGLTPRSYTDREMPRTKFKQAVPDCLAKGFPGLSEEERKELQQLGLVLHYGPDELVAQEGSFCAGVYLVCHGLVAIGKYAPTSTLLQARINVC